MMMGSGLVVGKILLKDLLIELLRGELVNFLNWLYYLLGLDVLGMYFMGVILVFYGVVFILGVLLYLLCLKKDLLVVCLGCNFKCFWMDMYNVFGLFSLFFYFIFVIIVLVLCLSIVLMIVFNMVVFNGKLFDVVLCVIIVVGMVVVVNCVVLML